MVAETGGFVLSAAAGGEEQGMAGMNDEQVGAALAALNATADEPWVLEAGALVRRYQFPDFRRAFAFMSELALYAERSDHHPDWRNCYRRVELRLWSFDIDGLSERDFDFAAEAERVARSLGGA